MCLGFYHSKESLTRLRFSFTLDFRFVDEKFYRTDRSIIYLLLISMGT